MDASEKKYAKWLLRAVLIEGRTTLWCARQIKGEPDEVERDFNRYLWKKRNRYTKTNRFQLPPN